MFAKSLIYLIRFYQKVLSPDQGVMRSYLFGAKGHCLMFPTCSSYMIASIEKYGPWKGVIKGVRRILRCHPYQKQLIDEP